MASFGLPSHVMGVTASSETISTADGGEMGVHACVPGSGAGAGVLVLMEIYGLGPYVKRAAERLAELGYVALAPDLYRRIEPGLELGHDEAGTRRAMASAKRLDERGAVQDAGTALEALRARPEVDGRKAAVLGFCLGGRLAYELAAAADPDAAVCYYGSGIADALDRVARIECPVLFHFGAEDPYVPRGSAERVATVAAATPGWECHIHPEAGHAFDNHESPMFHRPGPAARAWELTRDFLARHLA